MMDEQLIDEVVQHSVIYNRQKYYMNGSNGSGSIKYETKDGAWQIIAMKLRSDVETCKKRWKYLRERYVSQRKQGDPPVYEHLSRPYLEKMKFLDQHIQPRKSYRSMPNYLTSPHSANSSFNGDFNMDTKSNGSIKSMNIAHYPNPNNHHYNHVQSQDQHAMDNGSGHVKIEADQMFRDFAAAVASQQLHQHQVAAVAAAIADSSQNFQENFRESSGNPMHTSSMSNNHNAGLPVSSSSSTLKSPLSSSMAAGGGTTGLNGNMASGTPTQNNTQSSPTSTSCTNPTATGGYAELNTDDLDSPSSLNFNMKKPRVQLNNNIVNGGNMNGNNSSFNNSSNNNNNNNNNNTDDSDDDDSDEKSSSLMQPQMLHANENPLAIQRHTNVSSGNNSNANQITSNAEFLFQLYQQLPHQQQQQLTASGFSQQQQQQLPQHQQQQQQTHFNKYQMSANSSTPIERSSEQLLGELVTSELLKMNKDRRKNVQKRILEILFFDD